MISFAILCLMMYRYEMFKASASSVVSLAIARIAISWVVLNISLWSAFWFLGANKFIPHQLAFTFSVESNQSFFSHFALVWQ